MSAKERERVRVFVRVTKRERVFVCECVFVRVTEREREGVSACAMLFLGCGLLRYFLGLNFFFAGLNNPIIKAEKKN